MALKKPGKIKSGLGTLIGNAGEYYVMAELLKRGVVAGLMPRNAPAFDIITTKGERTARIRVKTKSAQYDHWRWVAKKDGTLFKELSSTCDFTVLVDLAVETKDMDFFVVPTTTVEKWLKEDFERWVRTPGTKGQQRDPDNKVRAFSQKEHAEQLGPYRNAWDSLWL
jgi:hypothetical protein